jgi:hypothetical protein
MLKMEASLLPLIWETVRYKQLQIWWCRREDFQVRFVQEASYILV